nr:TlpA disulfide reductase family protein [Nitrospirillum iridis]
MAILRFLARIGVVASVVFCAGAACAADNVAAGAAPVLKGGITPFTETPGHPAVPDLALTRPDGSGIHLSDLKGHMVLLNLWATWCAPCVQELPSLDKLQGALGDKSFEVVALSLDRGGARVVTPFVQSHDITHLATWLDPKSTVMSILKPRGLPTTLLIDAEGHEIGRLEGDADWASPDAQALIKHYKK